MVGLIISYLCNISCFVLVISFLILYLASLLCMLVNLHTKKPTRVRSGNLLLPPWIIHKKYLQYLLLISILVHVNVEPYFSPPPRVAFHYIWHLLRLCHKCFLIIFVHIHINLLKIIIVLPQFAVYRVLQVLIRKSCILRLKMSLRSIFGISLYSKV